VLPNLSITCVSSTLPLSPSLSIWHSPTLPLTYVSICITYVSGTLITLIQVRGVRHDHIVTEPHFGPWHRQRLLSPAHRRCRCPPPPPLFPLGPDLLPGLAWKFVGVGVGVGGMCIQQLLKRYIPPVRTLISNLQAKVLKSQCSTVLV